jgi:ferrous iron transport protein A
VESLEGASSTTQRRLFSLGFVPGEQLLLEQRTPAYVVKVGWTRVALDRETAERVTVLPDPCKCNVPEHPG